jgi:hypothetical protein
MTRLDLAGRTFHHLRVVREVGMKHHMTHWLCECSCGRETVVRGSYLTGGTTKSCGNRQAHPRRRGNNPVDYHNVHGLIRENLGSASAYACTVCNGPATEWAYIGGCEDEVRGDRGTMPYCPHACTEHYRPVCRADNRLLDRLMRGEEA